jgi:hypothetical protein
MTDVKCAIDANHFLVKSAKLFVMGKPASRRLSLSNSMFLKVFSSFLLLLGFIPLLIQLLAFSASRLASDKLAEG